MTAATAGPAAGTVTLTCRFLFFCAGYYRYEHGYEPVLPGADRFAGEIVHPQHWPADLRWAGRRVVVVGSGATAVTLVPALARDAAHVTMLQRSPSYVLSVPTRDPLARRLFGGRLPLRPAAALVRARNIALVTLMYRLSRRFPGPGAPVPARRRAGPAAPGLRRRHPLLTRLRPVGPAAVRRARAATCSGPCARGARRWSPTGSPP